MKKNRITKIIKEVLQEGFTSNQSFPIKSIKFSDIKDLTSNIALPKDFNTNTNIRTEEDFNRWKGNFIKNYGSEGQLVFGKHKVGSEWEGFEIQNNQKWNKSKEQGSEAMKDYYGKRKYTGD